MENPALGLAGFSSTVMQITITNRAAFERVFHAQSSLILWPCVDTPKVESVQGPFTALRRGSISIPTVCCPRFGTTAEAQYQPGLICLQDYRLDPFDPAGLISSTSFSASHSRTNVCLPRETGVSSFSCPTTCCMLGRTWLSHVTLLISRGPLPPLTLSGRPAIARANWTLPLIAPKTIPAARIAVSESTRRLAAAVVVGW